jgi:enoyl-CoA hydratase
MMHVEAADWVGVIEVADFSPLTRGDVGFALELRDHVVDLSDDDHVKAIILRATGDDFAPAAGAGDVDPAEAFTSWPRDVAGAAALYQAMTFSKKVIITEVSGECSGSGTNLVLASDLTAASDDARFRCPLRQRPETNFVQLALTIRLDRAKAWAFRDRVLDAETAYRVGLVNSVVPRASLQDEARDFGARVARMPLDGVVMSKMLQQPVLDASGVGREFDMAGFYAIGAGASTATAGTLTDDERIEERAR